MNDHRPHMLTKVRSKKLMESMEDGPCTLRIASMIPGRRCSNSDTSVGTHLPVWGKGMSTKVTDMAVARGCYACHDIIDGKDPVAFNWLLENCPAATMERMLCGLTETHALLIDAGVIVIPDGRFV